MQTLKIATSLNVFVGHCPGEEGIARLARAGFEALDFNFGDLLDQVDWLDERAAGAYVDRYRAAADEVSLPFVQAHGPMVDIFTDAQAGNARKRALCPAAIRAAGQLGVKWMAMHPDVFNGPFDREHIDRVIDGNAAFFRSLLPYCEKWNVGLALENIMDAYARWRGFAHRHFGGIPAELCELVDRLNHPLIGICWDTGHAHLMSLDQRKAIASLGSRLKAVHIHENDGSGDDHLLPFACGKKGVEWPAVADGLRLAGYQGAFTYEAYNAFRALPPELFDQALKHGVSIARQLLGRM